MCLLIYRLKFEYANNLKLDLIIAFCCKLLLLFLRTSTRDNAYTLSTNTGQMLIDEIMVHRRVELWGEGFRWFDLKRLNLPLDRTGSNHKSSITNKVMTVAVDDNRWVWAIPQDEIDANPLVEQNPI